MTRRLVTRPASKAKPKKPRSYPWDDDYEEIVVYAPNVYENDAPQATGILDPWGDMLFWIKEPVGFHNFEQGDYDV